MDISKEQLKKGNPIPMETSEFTKARFIVSEVEKNLEQLEPECLDSVKVAKNIWKSIKLIRYAETDSEEIGVLQQEFNQFFYKYVEKFPTLDFVDAVMSASRSSEASEKFIDVAEKNGFSKETLAELTDIITEGFFAV